MTCCLLRFCRFDQVLLLDSDNFAVRDPTFLFESGVFRATGAVFWPDYWAPGNSVFNIEPESLVWELTGLNFVKSFEQESGQVLVDRRRHAAALDVLMFYAQPNNALYRFKVVYGDKDLFRLAWMRAGQPFHMIEHPPAWAGEMKPTGFCGLTMVQYEPEGSSILFMHRNSYKLSSNATTHRRVWQAVVEFVAPDVGQYKAPLWIPGEAAGYVVGKEPCYGPANITDKYAALTNRSNDNTGLGTGESHVYDTISGLETMMMRHAQDGLSMLD